MDCMMAFCKETAADVTQATIEDMIEVLSSKIGKVPKHLVKPSIIKMQGVRAEVAKAVEELKAGGDQKLSEKQLKELNDQLGRINELLGKLNEAASKKGGPGAVSRAAGAIASEVTDLGTSVGEMLNEEE